MDRQWMYNADKRSMEYINGLRGFLDQANRRPVSFVVHAEIAKMRRITHLERLFTPTYTVLDSCLTILFGPSTGKEES